MMGILVTLDAYGCANMPQDKQELAQMCLDAIQEAGMHPVKGVTESFSQEVWKEEFGDSVVTLIVPLRESHIAVHSWPHYRFVSVDLYTCGSGQKAVKAVAGIVVRLRPTKSELHTLERGKSVKKGGGARG